MNFDEIKGKFNGWKGDLKKKWGEITDDDWKQISGSKDKLIGILQQKIRPVEGSSPTRGG